MIETITVRKCDTCGREMKYGHVIITWPEGRKDDVCPDCAKLLNVKLKEMKEMKEMKVETDDSFCVVGIRDVPWILGKEAPFTDFGKFTDLMKAEVCRAKHKADFDHVVIVKNLDDAIELAAELKEE